MVYSDQNMYQSMWNIVISMHLFFLFKPFLNGHQVNKLDTFDSHRNIPFVDIDQQQYELTRYATVLPTLLDFADYCNDIIDIHPSTTPQYKCAVKVKADFWQLIHRCEIFVQALVHTFHLLSIFVSKEESANLSDSLKQERTVTNIIDLFHKVSQVIIHGCSSFWNSMDLTFRNEIISVFVTRY